MKILLPRGLEKSSNLYAAAFRWNRGTAINALKVKFA